MNFLQSFRVPLPAWMDWPALAVMAVAAPMNAAFIHSYCVYESGFRLYNAEIGGEYFYPGRTVPTGVLAIVYLVSFCAFPAILTFLALLPFRKRALHRWIVWACFTVFWTLVLFQMEIAIR